MVQVGYWKSFEGIAFGIPCCYLTDFAPDSHETMARTGAKNARFAVSSGAARPRDKRGSARRRHLQLLPRVAEALTQAYGLLDYYQPIQ